MEPKYWHCGCGFTGTKEEYQKHNCKHYDAKLARNLIILNVCAVAVIVGWAVVSLILLAVRHW